MKRFPLAAAQSRIEPIEAAIPVTMIVIGEVMSFIVSNTAMPAVLSSLEGVKEASFRTVGEDKEFQHFETTVPGTLTSEQYDQFVRDTVNFLDYVGEPGQVERRSMGKWVVAFLVLLTALCWLLKKEYWKDDH